MSISAFHYPYVRIKNFGQWALTLLIMVVRSPPLSSGFWASPTLEGSLRAFSLENVLHSEPTSITRSPGEKGFGQLIRYKKLNLNLGEAKMQHKFIFLNINCLS